MCLEGIHAQRFRGICRGGFVVGNLSWGICRGGLTCGDSGISLEDLWKIRVEGFVVGNLSWGICRGECDPPGAIPCFVLVVNSL